ncbi:hypothetical protein DB30_01020 [Enhygromyxa salina]|uniref:J domain-containing protein n=1 Tax=Enhygromyxa salina TaxID=215803 RepID=A0A0C2CYA7_9BACT|nr:hypothetical protein [Enhygromyxa salina]KIG12812.1 hypothetical protein DB30_01020 [Enhygromyxa salina]
MGDVDYYAILEVGPEAERGEIEDAYQRAVAGTRAAEPSRARMLDEARAVLLDPAARADYDARCVGSAVIEETVAAILQAHQPPVSARRLIRAEWSLALAALRLREDPS